MAFMFKYDFKPAAAAASAPEGPHVTQHALEANHWENIKQTNNFKTY